MTSARAGATAALVRSSNRLASSSLHLAEPFLKASRPPSSFRLATLPVLMSAGSICLFLVHLSPFRFGHLAHG
jgi:hypothetical protein